MESATLGDWLAYLEGLHPSEIDLGLDRVGRVARSLGACEPAARVITVAGTNGKGSVCAVLESVLLADGHSVGLYTSPHLRRFGERIRINGREVDDASICAAFERVEAARGDTSLTYFEFGTLAAFDLFAGAGVEVWVLEVGLGGRLDATNVIDADVAVVTSVGIDHAEWLGADRDAVGHEKAGIARPGRPLIVGDAQPPRGLLDAARRTGAELVVIGQDFDFEPGEDGWNWRGADGRLEHRLPLPALIGGYQVGNAAVALAALERAGLRCGRPAIERALRSVRVPGRFEIRAGEVETILDVAHNPDAASVLAEALAARPCAGRTLAVIGMYADKDAEGVAGRLVGEVDGWCAAALPGPRGRGADAMAKVLLDLGLDVLAAVDSPQAAWQEARARAVAGDRVVVLGSFATVAAVAVDCLD